MTTLTAFELEIARLVVAALNLETDPAAIEPDAPLFYDGLGLDSIDALELALAFSQEYGVQMKSDDERNGDIFSSLRRLSAFIYENRKGGAAREARAL